MNSVPLFCKKIYFLHSALVKAASSILQWHQGSDIESEATPNDMANYMSPESYEKIWKENFLLAGIHSLV